MLSRGEIRSDWRDWEGLLRKLLRCGCSDGEAGEPLCVEETEMRLDGHLS